MRTLSTLLLAASLSLATGVAFAQGNGPGAAGGSVRGGSAAGAGNPGAGVNTGAGRRGKDFGVGGRGSRRLPTGIGNSRVNSAISGQGRPRGHGRGR